MSDPLLDALRLASDSRGLFSRGHTIVVAMSGGQDSCALAHALVSLRVDLDLRLHAAHLNHTLRGDASDEDERSVSRLCNDLSLPLLTHRADIRAASRRTKRSIHETARIERQRFLERCASEVSADAIALAHTSDDRVETVLLNVIRGTGIRGLGAMRWREGKIIRPLLGVTRAATGAYCRRNSITPRFDASNRSLHYRRNLLRHELLPVIEARMNAGVRRAILELSDTAAAAQAYLDAECSRALERLAIVTSSGGWALPAEEYARLDPALRPLLVLAMISRVTGSDADITGRDLSRIDTALLSGERSTWSPGGRVSVSTGPALTVEPLQWPAQAMPFEIELPVPGRVHLPGRNRTVIADTMTLTEMPKRVEPTVAYLPVEAIRLPLTVRTIRDGDRMCPLGMKGHKKVRDHLRDARVPRRERESAVAVCDSQGILWIPGLAVDERARIRSLPAAVCCIQLLTPDGQIT